LNAGKFAVMQAYSQSCLDARMQECKQLWLYIVRAISINPGGDKLPQLAAVGLVTLLEYNIACIQAFKDSSIQAFKYT
jgi:hypothetical protein